VYMSIIAVQRIRLRARIPIPDKGEIGLPIFVPRNAIALNGSAPPRVVSIYTNATDGTYGTGQAIPIYVRFTSAVVVEGVPELVLNTGCHSEECSIKEVQEFTCQADEGDFAISFAGDTVVNVPADANQDQVKYALESLELIEEVTVAFGDSDDRVYSHGPRACTSVGNRIVVTFERTSYVGTDGDLPALRLDWMNAPLDPRTFGSLGDGNLLVGRFPASKVGLSEVTERQKGWKMDDARAVYLSGSGTKTLCFVYTVSTGDSTEALDVVAFGSGGSILSNRTHEPVNSLLPAPGENISVLFASAKSLSFDHEVRISTQPAYVTHVTTSNPDGIYTSGDVIEVIVYFNVPVLVMSGDFRRDNPVPYVFLNTGGVGGKALATRTNGTAVYFRYTIQEGDASRDMDYFDVDSLIVGNGSIRTASTMPTTLAVVALPGPASVGSISYDKDIIIDTRQPYVQNVTSRLPPGTYGAGQDIPITLTFNCRVAVRGNPYFLVATSIRKLCDGIVAAPTGTVASYIDPPLAGQGAEISIRFTLNVPLKAGVDSVLLHLPGFTSGDTLWGPHLRLGGTDGASFNGTWNGSLSTVELQPLVDLGAGAWHIIIEASNSLAIPAEGVIPRRSQLRLAFDGLWGHVRPTTVGTVQAIGFVSSGIGFSNDRGAEGVDLNLAFVLSRDLRPNDTVRIRVPTFGGPLVSGELPYIAGAFSRAFVVNWTAYDNVISLAPNITLTAGQAISLTVEQANGISLPVPGLLVNDPAVQISVSSSLIGATPWVPMASTQPVGRFLFSSIRFDPPVAGRVSAIVIAFGLGPDVLSAGDRIVLQLPAGFPAMTVRNLSLTSPENGTMVRGSYSNRRIVLQLLRGVRTMSNQVFKLTVGPENGLRLPVSGISGDRPNDVINISCISSTVPVGRTAALYQQYVGQARHIQLDYAPRQVLTAVDIRLNFSLSNSLERGDTVWLGLHDFIGASAHHVHLNSTNYNFTGVMTYNGTSFGPGNTTRVSVTLFVEESIPAGATVVLTIPAKQGIMLPPSGLLRNDARVLFSVSAARGSILPTPIRRSPCVGFCSSTITYSSSIAGTAVALRLGFSLSADLRLGDLVKVVLPGFQGSLTSSLSLGPRGSWYFSGSWDPNSGILQLQVKNVTVPAFTALSFLVRAVNGIRLPDVGLPANDPSLALSTNANNLTADCGSHGPSAGDVCAFTVSYSTSAVGSIVAVTVDFQVNLDLRIGDVVKVVLPGFTGLYAGSLSLSSSGSSAFTGTWSNHTEAVELLIITAIAARRYTIIHIGASNGLVTPSSGIGNNERLFVGTHGGVLEADSGRSTASCAVAIFPCGFLNASILSSPMVTRQACEWTPCRTLLSRHWL
jgi:hypothetical protein